MRRRISCIPSSLDRTRRHLTCAPSFHFSFKRQDSGASVDIGCGNEFGGGEDDVDNNVETVNNVVDETIGFDLHEIPMGKKDIKEYLQTYCKNLRQKLKDDASVPGPEV